MLVYGASLITLYATSALYHLGPWTGRWRTTLRAVDHANIFLVIAGTYTPICVTLLSGWLRPAVLVSAWTVAAAGMTLSGLMLRLPRWLAVALYVSAGWMALVPAPTLIQSLPLPASILLLSGGLLYTVGAAIYARRRPDPLPHIFGYHEVFHLFVIAGTVAFFALIWVWVVPFPRP